MSLEMDPLAPMFIGDWACIGLLLLCMGKMRTVKLQQEIQ